jgi:type IV secretory pathway VirB4 component
VFLRRRDPKHPVFMYAKAQAGIPFRHDFGMPGNTCVPGETGGGKSTYLCALAVALDRTPDATLAAFDVNRSLKRTIEMLGGTWLDLGGDNRIKLAPFANLKTLAKRRSAASTAETMIVSARPDRPLETVERRAIAETLSQIAGDGYRPSVTDFATKLEGIRSDLAHVFDAFRAGTGGTGILDGDPEDDIALNNRFLCFELEGLGMGGDASQMSPELLPTIVYISSRLDDKLRLGGPLHARLMDECAILFRHEVMRKRYDTWARTIRKYNGFNVVAAQNLGDFVTLDIGRTIISQSQNFIALANAQATTDEQLAFYRAAKFTDEEIVRIASAPEGAYWYFFKRGRQFREFQLIWNSLTENTFGAGAEEDNEVYEALKEMYPDTFPAAWYKHQATKENGLEDWARVWLAGPERIGQGSLVVGPQTLYPPDDAPRVEENDPILIDFAEQIARMDKEAMIA